MPVAKWNDTVLADAESSEVEKVEGNIYFPKSSINSEYFVESDHHTTCPWKGEAGYYHIKVDDDINKNAAWIYRDPKSAASQIKDHIAFWKGVEVDE